MRNQIASIGINQSEETYLLAPKSLYKGEPLSCTELIINFHEYRVYFDVDWQANCFRNLFLARAFEY